jgi:hypothetical protein
MARTKFNKKRLCVTTKETYFRQKLVQCYIRSIASYCDGNFTVWKVDHKYWNFLKMLYWRRLKKISWTDRVRNEEVLHIVKEERNKLQTLKRRKDWLHL